MAEKNQQPIKIDLNQFKLYIDIKNKIKLTLHFDSPSRRFYLSLIAFVANQMKMLGKVTSIPLQEHLELIVLVNKTVGSSAGSSEKENLLPRIYRKWKDALPNLEEAPLFRVLGRKREYNEDIAKTYQFTETEKDLWANLFEYKGSGGNVRLRFSIDKLGVSLNDVAILYEEYQDGEAWKRFLSSLREKVENAPEAVVLPLPDKPSIAVLPFVNMSEDPKQEYFSDGITEDIITNLSKLSRIFVISRNSSFLYRGNQVKIQEVAKDLGVRYVLEGSIRREGNKVRVTAQLIDGKTGQHIWAEKYDRELKDIFSVQDDVTRKVVSELALALTTAESDRLPRKHTESFEAYDLYLRAKMEAYVHKKENTLKGIEMCQRVIDLDPNFAGGYQLQSFLLSRGVRFGWFLREDLKKAFELAQKAISIDDKFPASHLALASVYLMQGKHDDALAAANRAANIVPGDSDTIVWLGYYLHWVGRGEEAVAAVKKSRELNPMYLSGGYPVYVSFMSQTCFTAGLYEEAMSNMKKAIELHGPSVHRYQFVIASYSMLGRMDEAKEAAQQLLKADPTFSLSSWEYGRMYKRSEDSERLYEALRKAGLK